jgi:hypothetical protein
MSIQSIVNTHTYVHMKNEEEYSYPRIRSDSASSVSNARTSLSIYNCSIPSGWKREKQSIQSKEKLVLN